MRVAPALILLLTASWLASHGPAVLAQDPLGGEGSTQPEAPQPQPEAPQPQPEAPQPQPEAPEPQPEAPADTCPAGNADALPALRSGAAAPGGEQPVCAMEVAFGLLAAPHEPTSGAMTPPTSSLCALVRITNNLQAPAFGWQLVYSSRLTADATLGAVLISPGDGVVGGAPVRLVNGADSPQVAGGGGEQVFSLQLGLPAAELEAAAAATAGGNATAPPQAGLAALAAMYLNGLQCTASANASDLPDCQQHAPLWRIGAAAASAEPPAAGEGAAAVGGGGDAAGGASAEAAAAAEASGSPPEAIGEDASARPPAASWMGDHRAVGLQCLSTFCCSNVLASGAQPLEVLQAANDTRGNNTAAPSANTTSTVSPVVTALGGPDDAKSGTSVAAGGGNATAAVTAVATALALAANASAPAAFAMVNAVGNPLLQPLNQDAAPSIGPGAGAPPSSAEAASSAGGGGVSVPAAVGASLGAAAVLLLAAAAVVRLRRRRRRSSRRWGLPRLVPLGCLSGCSGPSGSGEASAGVGSSSPPAAVRGSSAPPPSDGVVTLRVGPEAGAADGDGIARVRVGIGGEGYEALPCKASGVPLLLPATPSSTVSSLLPAAHAAERTLSLGSGASASGVAATTQLPRQASLPAALLPRHPSLPRKPTGSALLEEAARLAASGVAAADLTAPGAQPVVGGGDTGRLQRVPPLQALPEDASSSASWDSATAAARQLSEQQLLQEQPGWVDIDFSKEVRLERKMGAGGFGSVWAAVWRDEEVAVKLLPVTALGVLPPILDSSQPEGGDRADPVSPTAAHPSPSRNPGSGSGGVRMLLSRSSLRELRGIRQEVSLLARLRHPNIVAFKAACLAPPNICIVQELVRGGSLHTRLHGRSRRGRPPPLTYLEVVRIARDVAAALDYLHPGVVHRDLKPHNILLDLDGTAKVCDLGIASVKDATFAVSSRFSTVMAGTPAYMAPEQFEGRPVTERADVWSFGVLLWECAAQRLPWEGLGAMQVMYQVMIQGERPPQPPDCPPFLLEMMDACWREAPEARPPIRSLLQRLQQELAHVEGRVGAEAAAPGGQGDGEGGGSGGVGAGGTNPSPQGNQGGRG